MANREVGLPRFYIDFSALARVLGLWVTQKEEWEGGSYEFDRNSYVIDRMNSSQYDLGSENLSNAYEVWLGDYSTPKTFLFSASAGEIKPHLHMSFWNVYGVNYNLDWAKLMTTTNWYGVLNHSFHNAVTSDSDVNNVVVSGFFSNSNNSISQHGVPTGRNEDTVCDTQQMEEYNGFSITTFDNPMCMPINESNYLSHNDINKYGRFCVRFTPDLDGVFPNDRYEISIGALMFGKYFDMPHSPDLQVKKSISFDGVDSSRGVSGSDFVHINNTGLPAWQHGDAWKNVSYDNKGRALNLGTGGRRSWNMKFSYVSQSNMFINHHQDKSFGYLSNESSSMEFTEGSDGVIESIFQLTLGGAVPFVFCPDSNASASEKEFAVCRFAKDSLSITQTANNVWDVQMILEEVW